MAKDMISFKSSGTSLFSTQRHHIRVEKTADSVPFWGRISPRWRDVLTDKGQGKCETTVT